MAYQKELFKLYGVETGKGFTQFYTSKDEAIANSKDGVIQLEKVDMDKAHDLLAKYYTTASKRAVAGRKGQQARQDKYSSEERSNQAKAGGVARAKQMWGDK